VSCVVAWEKLLFDVDRCQEAGRRVFVVVTECRMIDYVVSYKSVCAMITFVKRSFIRMNSSTVTLLLLLLFAD
jgi:hypothetical protein